MSMQLFGSQSPRKAQSPSNLNAQINKDLPMTAKNSSNAVTVENLDQEKNEEHDDEDETGKFQIVDYKESILTDKLDASKQVLTVQP